jgi:lipoate-protein ligase B
VTARWLGRIEYGAALELQSQAARRCAEKGEETLFLLEHEPVFTLGRNADPRDILYTPEQCAALGIRIYETDRGGKATYHGPGQLVGYPILHLGSGRRDVKRYVTDLEESLILTLRRFGVEASRSRVRERVTSLWVGNDKIAAIGVHIARWVTTHGFALNVTTRLDHFQGIIPCGITDGGVTSMEKILGRPVPLEDVAKAYREAFETVFGRQTSGI